MWLIQMAAENAGGIETSSDAEELRTLTNPALPVEAITSMFVARCA